MATKSILKNVNIKKSRAARQLVVAMENASCKRGKTVVISRPVSDASREEIRQMFKS